MATTAPAPRLHMQRLERGEECQRLVGIARLDDCHVAILGEITLRTPQLLARIARQQRHEIAGRAHPRKVDRKSKTHLAAVQQTMTRQTLGGQAGCDARQPQFVAETAGAAGEPIAKRGKQCRLIGR